MRAVVVFVVLMGLFYGLVHTPGGDHERLAPYLPETWSQYLTERYGQYLAMIADISGGMLNVLAQDADVVGPVITASGFGVTIARGCDALEPIAAFVSAVVASPLALRVKLPGIAIGTVCLWLINLVRIVSLVWVGVHFPKVFDMIHGQIWQAAFIVLAIVFWAVWVQWATRTKTARSDVST